MDTRFYIGTILLAAILLGLGGCDNAPKATEPSPVATADAAQGVIVCMGDSLTAGYGVDEAQAYPALLETKLREAGFDYQVINAGISGETSSGALSRLDWTLTLNPDILVLATGANDGLRGVDPTLTHRNIEAMVSELEGRGIVVVLGGMQMVRNLGSEFTRSFNAIYPDIARASDSILIPFILEGVAGRPALNQADGIHPTPDGYRIMVNHIFPFVVQAVERHREKSADGA
ncbi:MAG: arylesterase [Desulfobacterales bacterium]|jgi:acyl-CoA thioesterase-1